MANYSQDAKEAEDTLREDGVQIAISRRGGIFDPVTGSERPAVPPEEAPAALSGQLWAVILSQSETASKDRDASQTPATVVAGERRKVIAGAYSAVFRPQTGDVLAFDGAEWTVSEITFLQPGLVDVLYTLKVAKAGPTAPSAVYAVKFGTSIETSLTEEQVAALPNGYLGPWPPGPLAFLEHAPGAFCFVAVQKSAPAPLADTGFFQNPFAIDMAGEAQGYPLGATGWGRQEVGDYYVYRSFYRLGGNITINLR